MRARRHTPVGHGEVLTEPAYALWAQLATDNAERAAAWHGTIAGVSLHELRRAARAEAIAAAGEFSAGMGISITTDADPDGLIVMTGHQPELYHPGIWVKDFLLQRLAEQTGAAAIDVVVDSDGFERVELRTPCFKTGVGRCSAVLAESEPDGCYGCTPAPTPGALAAFCDAGREALATLPAPALTRHFESFCAALFSACAENDDLAAAITVARRRYEAPAGSTYLELRLLDQARTPSFLRFVTHVALHAASFATSYNAELAAFRERTGARSLAQPFPDLGVTSDAIEVPFWSIIDGRRRTMWVRSGPQPALMVDGSVLAELHGDPEEAYKRLMAADLTVAPKALALTMFERVFVADLFIHGVGGGRYDQVTDGVISRFFGIEPPRFVVASMTLYLPLGAHDVTAEEIAEVEQRLNRLTHNPDQLLGEMEFEGIAERDRVTALAAEKCELVLAIASPDADKKAIGARIRSVNAEMAELMSPFIRETEAELAELKTLRDAGEVLTDRTYPFCLWDPLEVADKVR
ncbi:MAG: hypothetical protein D9V44_01890 [Actinobacteria bacterium]|nr:MAG: hypothetical protein D9V44_01890 [Actinomycetota bacterium]